MRVICAMNRPINTWRTTDGHSLRIQRASLGLEVQVPDAASAPFVDQVVEGRHRFQMQMS